MASIQRVAQLKTSEQLRQHLDRVGAQIPFVESVTPQGPLSQPHDVAGRTIGNRFAILPMEGWDGTTDGMPTELTHRRWHRFGQSGAKLIWGGEAVAVTPDGRANPNQLMMNPHTEHEIGRLREELLTEHRNAMGSTEDLLIGLQLTHSGRFARPHDKKKMEPRILYRHPVLDRKFALAPDYPILTDGEIEGIITATIDAAKRAHKLGFDFVDIKHCHGYLGHEFLSAHDRPGPYGGSFHNRTRYLRTIVQGIQAEAPGLLLGVRLSVVDFCPFKPSPEGTGIPDNPPQPYPYAFGGDDTGTGINLNETIQFLKLMRDLKVPLVCTTMGSPYYCPHLQRPAVFPPSDGYQPPEEPFIGVARHLAVTAELKKAVPEMTFVGSGYTYLQEWIPHVAEATVQSGMTDLIGLGRLVLSYPELPADVVAGRALRTKQICRTFSDCTTAPRNGLVSGCYPLDAFYKERPEARELLQLKQAAKKG